LCFGGEHERYLSHYGYPFGTIPVKNEQKIELMKYRKYLREQLPGLKSKRDELENKLKSDQNNEKLKCERASLSDEIHLIESQLKGSLGDTVFRGIVGKKGYEMVEDIIIGDDIFQGIYQGIVFRSSLSVGEPLGKEIDGIVAVLFQVVLGKIQDTISSVYRFFFHDSCKPFNVTELASWNKLVGSDFREIENMIKNAEKYDSRGRAEILREYKTENLDEVTVASINLWNDFVEDVANTYEDLAEEIDLRKGFYDDKENGFGVVRCAERLKNKLLKAKNWLLRVESLKEFVNMPEIKSILPSMRKSFDIYFENLVSQIQLPDTKKGALKSSNYTSDGWSSSYDDDDDFPAGYGR
jgi:hypothetical protein